MAGLVRAVARLLLHAHGRLAAGAVHRPLAGQDPAGPGQQRDRPRGRHLHDASPRSPAPTCRQDRLIDGVDQTDFLLGKQEKSNREGFPSTCADRLHAVKWRNWKVRLLRRAAGLVDPAAQARQPEGVRPDHRPEGGVSGDGIRNTWNAGPLVEIVTEFEASLKQHPPIAPGTPDPYDPSR